MTKRQEQIYNEIFVFKEWCEANGFKPNQGKALNIYVNRYKRHLLGGANA